MDSRDIMQKLAGGELGVGDALALFRRGVVSSKIRLTPLDREPEPRRVPLAEPPRVRLKLLDDPPAPQAAPSVEVKPEVRGPSPEAPPAARPVSDPEVVRLSYPVESVAVVALEDREHRNMLSEGVVLGLRAVFERIAATPDTKVVVVHGFDTWFCSGGTPDALDAIREGHVSFTAFDDFKILLDCELPTIAAMQGHALGAGCTFGLYADLIVMASESYYAGNFMAHGFTPGVGATLVFPYKLGRVLGDEMLFTARRYPGRELKERGVTIPVVERDHVVELALEQARSLAEKPLQQLKLLKKHMAHRLRTELPAVLQAELAMHRDIFA